ncbi:MAG: phosphoenolpyruvate carboxykinase (GTP) [Brachybacterium sp.]|nr:phosphoenolpyruvate carboxykinase (GTP) [Brachybacterium sp.]
MTQQLDTPIPLIAPPGPGRPALDTWVEEVRRLAEPERVQWCDGSDEEYAALLEGMVTSGALTRLNEDLRPGSYLALSDPDDVARVESRTFICSSDEADAGPTNNWRDPQQMRTELQQNLRGAMRGRTLYVVPFSMGPIGGAISQVGVEITDSPYVVASLRIMTRMGADALRCIDAGDPWVPCLHSVGMPLVDDEGRRTADVPWPSNPHKTIAHFPDTREIWSYGSGYGGNALLAKKCFALRIASVMARDDGWLAEHMLLIRVISPEGKRYHVAGAFPSATGKTNFAMMQPGLPGWRVETLGDDIAWLREGEDGRLWAINPEAGFFGVVPGTSEETNPVAMRAIEKDTIFTNVALTAEGDVWWEGATDEPPEGLTTWRGELYDAASSAPAAHPNSRFTVDATQAPTLSEDWDSPDGVPLDAIIFGGRRRTNVPLVSEAADWEHGVFFGATIASEQTAAAEGPVGKLRLDPFAMLPFCGYNMADHWQHWLDVGEQLGEKAPRIFRVNWFRRDDDGAIMWPGFGENIRVLQWIVARLEGEVEPEWTAVGGVPRREDLDVGGLALDEDTMERILAVDPGRWAAEARILRAHFDRFGDRVPGVLWEALEELEQQVTTD